MKALRKILNYLSILILIFLALFILANKNDQDEKNKIVTPNLSNSNVNFEKVEWKVHPDGTVIHQGSQLVLDRNYTMIINNPNKCNDLRSDSMSILIVILSNVINFERRQIIRETWGLDIMQHLGNYKVVFIVGLTNSSEVQERLKFENLIYQDIIQINIQDTFYNLTYKSIHMLYWYIEYCSNAKFLFKTDDDIYLHLPNVIKLLVDSVHLNNTILCRRNRSRKILRNANIKDLFFYSSLGRIKDKQLVERSSKKFQKYIVEYKQLPGNLYPDYCSGYSYVMNQMVARKLFKASETIPYIGIEDVFITGFCRCKANVTITNSQQFRLNPFIQPIESRCAFETGRINSNEMNIHDIKILWIHVNTQGYYCKFSNSNSSHEKSINKPKM